MANVNRTESQRRTKSASAPDHLTMTLFAPGMSSLHRAGLGGLACTLDYIERARRQGLLTDEDVPGGPWKDGEPPWSIAPDQITLRFGAPDAAGEYLRRLFSIAFQTRDGLIYLPGQHDLATNQAVLADLQLGLTLTFLQHGKTRTLAKEVQTVSHDPDGAGVPGVVVSYRACAWFKHQDGWQDCVDKRGALCASVVGIEGPLLPGAVVRHNAFSAPTKIGEPVERLLPLYFALVGCVALPINRGVGILIVPEIQDLMQFALVRPLMTPTSGRESLAAGSADAGLQLQVRMRMRNQGQTSCHALAFRSTPWAKQQKSRVESLCIPVLTGRDLDVYELALAALPPRIAIRKVKETLGKGKSKQTTELQESFRVDSVIRPLIAENLAQGRKWYYGFTRLMTAINPATDKPYRNQITFERRGLNAMVTDKRAWDDDRETLVVRAVHEAISYRLGQIRSETDGDRPQLSQATKNRWEKFRDGVRLSLAGAKTQAQVRFVLCDLFSRAGRLPSLKGGWQSMLPMFSAEHWQQTRDLALLACASYAGKEVESEESAVETN